MSRAVGYQLGVDLGTTYTAAAVGREGRAEQVTLGVVSPVMPSVVLPRADGEVLVGEAAVRRALSEPNRVGREFKRRLGDPAPLVLGGTPYSAESLMGMLLRDVVRTVTEREGAAPDAVVLTHPANYGPYKLEQMREVARLAGLDLDTTTLLTEPQAAAISYASRSRVEVGQVVAVYDLGGGTFDAALVRRGESGFDLVGRPEGMERFGGIDIDAAVLAHVDRALGGRLATLDPDDPVAVAAVARLRDDCRAAKEALSSDTDTTIAVALPGVQTQVRLTRVELEAMIRPRVAETVAALERAVRSAGLTVDQVDRVLLVGGSSRMPLVAETIQNETGRPVAIDAHPKFAIALGAASWAPGVRSAGAAVVPAAPVVPAMPVVPATPAAGPPTRVLVEVVEQTSAPISVPVVPPPAAPAVTPSMAAVTPPASRPATSPPAAPPSSPTAARSGGHVVMPPRRRAGRTALFVVLGLLVGAGVAGGTYLAVRSDDDRSTTRDGTAEGSGEATVTTVAATSPLVTGTDPPVTGADGTSTPTDPPSTDLPAPEDVLLATLDADRPLVESLVGTWVPQVSAKRPGVEADGIVYQYPDILALHRRLVDLYGALLLYSGEYNYKVADLWVSVVPLSFASAEGALKFCTDAGIDRENCFAKLITHDMSIDDTTELLPE